MLALTEAEFGNHQRVSELSRTAIALSPGIATEAIAAQALARSFDVSQAQKIADDLSRRFPQNTVLNAVSVPVIRASVELQRSNPKAAIESLQQASAYELGVRKQRPSLASFAPIYLRGEAYLRTGAGQEAAAEFQKILGHRGVDPLSFYYALAHLGLGRAYALQGDTTKARIAYQDFLALWKDADPDIPILRAAKSEYAKLH